MILVTVGLVFFAVLIASFVLAHIYIRLTSGVCKCKAKLHGKTALLTGASSGIGKETARELLRRHCSVIFACRNLKKAKDVANELQSDLKITDKVSFVELDLSDLESVKKCAEEIKKKYNKIDYLINNAGMAECFDRKTTFTKDGFEEMYQNNFLGHFLLTHLLLGVEIVSLHPGVVGTEFFKPKTVVEFFSYTLTKGMIKTTNEGAQTTLHLVLCPEIKSGSYYSDCRLSKYYSNARDFEVTKKVYAKSLKDAGLPDSFLYELASKKDA